MRDSVKWCVKEFGGYLLLGDDYLFLFRLRLHSLFQLNSSSRRLGLLQVFRVKPFGEPVVDLGQHLASFVLLALLLPQSARLVTARSSQRLRLLAAGNFDGFLKARFGFRLGTGR